MIPLPLRRPCTTQRVLPHSALGTQRPNWQLGANCTDAVCGIASMFVHCRPDVGPRTSSSVLHAWPCSSTIASGMGARFTALSRRQIQSGGAQKYIAIPSGTRTLTSDFWMPAGLPYESGNTRT